MMFLDACRNVTMSGARDAAAPIDPMVELSSSKGLRLLVSTDPRTRSYEYDDLRHGLFTYYVIEGLKGTAARADGLVTFGSLPSYVMRKAKDRNPNQAPYTDGQSTGESHWGGNTSRQPRPPPRLRGALSSRTSPEPLDSLLARPRRPARGLKSPALRPILAVHGKKACNLRFQGRTLFQIQCKPQQLVHALALRQVSSGPFHFRENFFIH